MYPIILFLVIGFIYLVVNGLVAHRLRRRFQEGSAPWWVIPVFILFLILASAVLAICLSCLDYATTSQDVHQSPEAFVMSVPLIIAAWFLIPPVINHFRRDDGQGGGDRGEGDGPGPDDPEGWPEFERQFRDWCAKRPVRSES